MTKLSKLGASVIFAGALTFSGAALAQGPGYNWSGIYVGAHAGYGMADIDSAFTLPAIAGAPIPTNELDKGVVGVHVGVQHQFGAIVLGVEGGYTTFFGKHDRQPFGPPVGPAITEQGRLNGIAWIGPRIGWALGNWMPYVAGGYATTNIETGLVTTGNGVLVVDARERHDGWYLGGGLDWAITSQLVLGIDYRHYDFDSKDHVPTITGTNVLIPALTTNVDAKADVITARLSFKFGRPAEAKPLK